MEWSQEKILQFIEQYRKKPMLWNAQDPQYFNKFKKHDGWQELAVEFETTQEECKRKMTSLLASLRREKSKISKSSSTGKGKFFFKLISIKFRLFLYLSCNLSSAK